jgi:hypothetical protein
VSNPWGDTNAFPHTITGGANLPDKTSTGHSIIHRSQTTCLFRLHSRRSSTSNSGQDDDTDVLTVSFSANDYVGHRFGPYSQEVMDVTLRTDRNRSQRCSILLMRALDCQTRSSRSLPITASRRFPEHAAALGLGGGDPFADVMREDSNAISARYNPQGKSPDPSADYLLRFSEGNDAGVVHQQQHLFQLRRVET